ncbi:MAG: hypothetical protein HOO86_14185 [Bacteroidales bacterium]|nr:hypothetical protein [Bacteroidales bacterium]
MKSQILKKIILLAAIAVLVVVADTSCKKFQNIGDGVKLIIDYNLIKTSISVQLVDATTGELVGQDGSISVKTTITGEDKAGVIDITGTQNANFEYMSQRGFVSLALQPESMYRPSESNPISFNIVANHPGYIATSQHVVIAAEGENFVILKMVKLDNPPSGVTVVQLADATTTDGNGRVTAPVTVETPQGEASLTIPEGIVLKDAGGEPLNGNLDVTLVHFDNTDTAAMRAFPGGLMTNVTRLNGSGEDGMFYSAGFVAIEITDGSGNRAANFEDGALKLISQVSPDTKNPETNTFIADGDEIPLWSFDEFTGLWTEESMLTIENVGGTFQVQAEINHLSYYNFDWFYGGSYCDIGVTFIFTADQPLCDCQIVHGTMYRSSDGAYLKTIYMWVCGTEPVYTYYAPSGVAVYIVWDNYYSNVTVDPANNPTNISDLCSTVPVTINLITNNNSSHVTVEVEAYCASDPSVIIRPSYGAWFRLTSDFNWRWAEMINGYADICDVIIGETYVVGVYYDGQWYETEVTVEQSSYSYVGFELPADVCEQVFGL